MLLMYTNGTNGAVWPIINVKISINQYLKLKDSIYLRMITPALPFCVCECVCVCCACCVCVVCVLCVCVCLCLCLCVYVSVCVLCMLCVCVCVCVCVQTTTFLLLFLPYIFFQNLIFTNQLYSCKKIII